MTTLSRCIQNRGAQAPTLQTQLCRMSEWNSEASSNDSQTLSPDLAPDHDRSEWSPAALQAEYFVFPDPFSSGRRASSSRERIRSYSATSSDDEGSTSEDETQTEDRGGIIPENASFGQGTEQGSAPPPDKETNQFLPLLKDEPNYPRNPTLNGGLEKIKKRLNGANPRFEEPSTQSSRAQPNLGVHSCSSTGRVAVRS